MIRIIIAQIATMVASFSGSRSPNELLVRETTLNDTINHNKEIPPLIPNSCTDFPVDIIVSPDALTVDIKTSSKGVPAEMETANFPNSSVKTDDISGMLIANQISISELHKIVTDLGWFFLNIKQNIRKEKRNGMGTINGEPEKYGSNLGLKKDSNIEYLVPGKIIKNDSIKNQNAVLPGD